MAGFNNLCAILDIFDPPIPVGLVAQSVARLWQLMLQLQLSNAS